MSETCCAERRVPGRWPRYVPCTNKAKTTHDGKPYCGIHDPQRVAKKRAESEANWRAARAAEAAIAEHERACLAAIASIGGDPATVAELVAAYNDAASALAYIKTTHGALYGVGWERLADTARAVLAKLPQENSND